MILFYDEIKKTNPHTTALRMLRGFLDKNEPQLVYWLHHIWNRQQNAVTYKQIREAIMNGGVTQQMIDEWQQDYSLFVVEYLRPMWEAAMIEATAQLSQRYPVYAFDPSREGVKMWVDTRAAAFVTNSTQAQIQAVNTVCRRAAVIQDMTVDGLARAIRPMVGLTVQQSAANLRYYTSMIEGGLSQRAALERSIKYSARQHRYRGYNIARTELAFAYNKGQHFGVKQAISQGLMGRTRKTWCTADDERVCKICGRLEGVTIELDEEFNYYTKLQHNNPGIKMTPPAHPSCRCTALYIEESPPDYSRFDTIE